MRKSTTYFARSFISQDVKVTHLDVCGLSFSRLVKATRLFLAVRDASRSKIRFDRCIYSTFQENVLIEFPLSGLQAHTRMCIVLMGCAHLLRSVIRLGC